MIIIDTVDTAKNIISRIFDGATLVEKEGSALRAYLPAMHKQDAEDILAKMSTVLTFAPHNMNTITIKYSNTDIDPRGLRHDFLYWSKRQAVGR